MERVIVWHRWSVPPEPSPEAIGAATAWRDAARDRFAQTGAEVLFELGGSIAFALDVAHVVQAVELCMSALRDAKQDEAAGGVACGITLGFIARSGAATYVGDALDRAQVLANAAAAQEIMLDAAVRAAAAGAFLFEREVTFSDGPSAAVLDRNYPRKSDCQRALFSLGQVPLLADEHPPLAPLHQLAEGLEPKRVLVIAPHGFGFSAWLARFAAAIRPTLWLDVHANGAVLAPLSGLMHALARLPEELSPERVLRGTGERDAQARAQLVSIRQGDAVARRDAIVALRHFFARVAERGGRLLVTVDPAPLVDPSTVGVIAEACRDHQLPVLAVVRTLVDAKPPSGFARDGELVQVRLTELGKLEGRALAANLLGVELPSDIARRAASLGGGTPLAIAETVRLLVSAGDIVFEDGGFRWRRGPTGNLTAQSLEALLEERIDGLAAPLRRALEVLAALPDPEDTALAIEVARANGLMDDAWTRAVDDLAGLGFVSTRPGPHGPSAQIAAVVRVVLRAMSTPGRDRELNRSVASALEHRPDAQGRFARANYAYYLAHAARKADAATILLDVAALAGQMGYLRSGVRLAAAAVESDTSPQTRARAAQIAQKLAETHSDTTARSTHTNLPAIAAKRDATGGHPLPADGSDSMAGETRQRAVEAMLARDYDEIDRAIELLTAAGYDGASIDRLRVVTLLIKGDQAGAETLLARLRSEDDAGDGHSPKTPQLTLTAALTALATGELKQAVRESLSALARTREARDALGQRASLSVLSLCYRGLGRTADAARFAEAAIGGVFPGSPRLRETEVGGS